MIKTIGIVAEYNPFHKGHKYHLEESLKVTDANTSVAVMSGNFVQRGEPAIINKNARARAAVLSGIDLVLELPTVFSLSSAEIFAKGAVNILNSSGIVDYICFGTETNDIDQIKKVAKFLLEERVDFKEELKNGLDKGLSYTEAIIDALIKTYDDPILIDSFFKSNNILAIEYIKALYKTNSSIIPVAINRMFNNYNDTEMTSQIAGATAIRHSIYKNNLESVRDTMTTESFDILNKEFSKGKGPVSIQCFEDILLWSIRSKTAEELGEYTGIGEGLENRIIKAAKTACSVNELIHNIRTRRYPEPFVRRLLLNIALGVTKEDISIIKSMDSSSYIKVLDFSENGRKLLASMRKKSSVPIITKSSKLSVLEDKAVQKITKINSRAFDLYVLGYNNDKFKCGGQEYTSNHKDYI